MYLQQSKWCHNLLFFHQVPGCWQTVLSLLGTAVHCWFMYSGFASAGKLPRECVIKVTQPSTLLTNYFGYIGIYYSYLVDQDLHKDYCRPLWQSNLSLLLGSWQYRHLWSVYWWEIFPLLIKAETRLHNIQHDYAPTQQSLGFIVSCVIVNKRQEHL